MTTEKKTSKKYIDEYDTMSVNAPLAQWEDYMNYPSYYDYIEQFSTYHFNKWADDSELDINSTGLSFRGTAIDNLMNEVEPFVREKGRNASPNDKRFLHNAYWSYVNEIRGLDHVGYKELVKAEKHPTLTKITDWFEFEPDSLQSTILEKNIGNWEVWHVDVHPGHPEGFGKQPLIRLLVHLQDWEFGQMLQWGTKTITQWRAGDVLTWDPNIPHASANSSRSKRYSLRLTGVPSKNTLTKIKQGGIINVDEL